MPVSPDLSRLDLAAFLSTFPAGIPHPRFRCFYCPQVLRTVGLEGSRRSYVDVVGLRPLRILSETNTKYPATSR